MNYCEYGSALNDGNIVCFKKTGCLNMIVGESVIWCNKYSSNDVHLGCSDDCGRYSDECNCDHGFVKPSLDCVLNMLEDFIIVNSESACHSGECSYSLGKVILVDDLLEEISRIRSEVRYDPGKSY